MSTTIELFYVPASKLKAFYLWLEFNCHDIDTISNEDLHSLWTDFVHYSKTEKPVLNPKSEI